MKKEKIGKIAVVALMAVLMFGLSLWSWFKPTASYSDSERRVLASFPKLNVETVLDGKFTKNFETYVQDQFPLRDQMRGLKAATNLYVFRQKDNNDLYFVNGYASKLDYPLQEPMLDHAAERFQHLYESYLKPHGSKVYLSVIPDKNYFLAQENGYLSLDYEALFRGIQERCPEFSYIDLTGQLTLDDFYRTDTHWRQENLLPVAQYLAGQMGVTLPGEDYTEVTVETPFKGVYVGQSALPLKPDTLRYLTSPVLEDAVVTSFDQGVAESIPLYDLKKAEGRDPYEMFTGGSNALVTIENPNAHTDRELIIFRDSFSGSLAPLLVEGYAKITLADIRYIQSDLLDSLVDFHGQDTLFLYSSMLLNSSLGLK